MIDLNLIPKVPGVYIIKDRLGRIIYIGKARNLRNRVKSYFSKNSQENYKTQTIRLFASKIEFITADSEREALIIERRLISLHKPIFNVMWKDSKSYPYLVITDEDFPRLILTRKKDIKGSYYGPYPSSNTVKKLIEKLRDVGLIKLRRCNYTFSSQKPLDAKKRDRCIYYHTMQCPAPCDKRRIDFNEYKRFVKIAKNFFSFKHLSLLNDFKKRMLYHASKLEYEKAKEYRDCIEAINHMYERVSVDETNLEELERRYDFTATLVGIKEKLGLKNIPYHIESFDVSNVMNKYICGVCVCFINGNKNTTHYRRFKAKFNPTKSGGDDYAVMYEIVKRRYDDEKEFPDLIIIDGGIGQLNSAIKALSELKIKGVDVISIAKEKELIYTPISKEPVSLEKDSKELLLLLSIRDETHRFAVSYHRRLREIDFRI